MRRIPESEREPFGPSPYDHLQKLVEKLERAVGMDWTNNVWQAAPQTPEEADEAWDEAHAMAVEIEGLAQNLERAACVRQREVLALIDEVEAEKEAARIAASVRLDLSSDTGMKEHNAT